MHILFSVDNADQSIENENEETEDSAAKAKCKKQGPLLPDLFIGKSSVCVLVV